MSEDRIRVAATNGEDTVVMGLISCGRQYVFGQVIDEGSWQPYHYTYHENGYMHQKLEPRTPRADERPLYYGPPLDDFSGFVSTNNLVGIPHEVGRITSPNIGDEHRGFDNITYIDVRNSEYGMMYTRFICESGFPVGEYIHNYLSNVEQNTDVKPKLGYQVYTGTEPWVGVAYWQQAANIHGFGATTEFRPMGVGVEIKERENPYPAPCPNHRYGCDGPIGSGPICMDCYEMIENK